MLSEHVSIKFRVKLRPAIEHVLIIPLEFLTRYISSLKPGGLAVAKLVPYVQPFLICEELDTLEIFSVLHPLVIENCRNGETLRGILF